MSVERINSQLKKVREQIAQLQAKEKDLAEQKQMAEDAEAMKIIRNYKISSERLQMLNKLSEDEVRNLLQKREQEKEDSTNENEDVIRSGTNVPDTVGNTFLYADWGIFCQQDKYDRGSCGGYSRAENRKCGRGKQCRKHSVR